MEHQGQNWRLDATRGHEPPVPLIQCVHFVPFPSQGNGRYLRHQEPGLACGLRLLEDQQACVQLLIPENNSPRPSGTSFTQRERAGHIPHPPSLGLTQKHLRARGSRQGLGRGPGRSERCPPRGSHPSTCPLPSMVNYSQGLVSLWS